MNMNKKEIINLIKDKANEKSIIDVSLLIKDKLKNSQYVIKEEITLPQRRFSFKPLYLSFVSIFVIAIAITLLIITKPIQNDLLLDSEFSDSVILSALSSIELIENPEEIGYNDSYNTLLSDETSDDYVENQIDEVMKYAKFMEVFLNNDDTLKKEIIKSSYQTYKKAVSYTLTNLTGDQIIYNLYYKQTIDEKKQTYRITGLLQIGESLYPVLVTGQMNQKNHLLIYKETEDTYVRVFYHRDEKNNLLRVKKYTNLVLEEETTILYQNNTKATLSFVKGNTKGVYEFSISETSENKNMHINYKIDDIDQGSIDVELSKEAIKNYILNIIPDNRPATVVEKERKNEKNQTNGKDKENTQGK